MMYQVGDLSWMELKEGDPTFEEWDEAHDYAILASYDDRVQGIWRRDRDDLGTAELVALVYQQTCFEK